MPELPEVEAVCRVARRALDGWRICLPQTPRQVAAALAGKRCLAVERLGKNILIHLEGATLTVHLRMTGNLYALAHPGLRPRTTSAHLVLDDGRALVFDDPRGLGILRLGRPPGPVGPDPLSREFTPQRFAEMARAGRSPIKVWLMDQRRVAGLGNIYAAEALHRAGIDPRRLASTLRVSRLNRLHAAIVAILAVAVESASRAYRRPGGFADGEWFTAAVYGRDGLPCRRCRRLIRRIPQGGRSTYFCPGCQR